VCGYPWTLHFVHLSTRASSNTVRNPLQARVIVVNVGVEQWNQLGSVFHTNLQVCYSLAVAGSIVQVLYVVSGYLSQNSTTCNGLLSRLQKQIGKPYQPVDQSLISWY